MSILVTGGLGYIGSHTCVELIEHGKKVIIVDNLSNSNIKTLHRINTITGKNITFYEADLLDKEALHDIFDAHSIEAVIHFAGLKAVNESVHHPLTYYQNNVVGTIALCEVMKTHNVKNMIFSSSATVYGNPEVLPITEQAPLSTLNPYGTTKLMIENILKDVSYSDKEWSIVALRYFNPIGAHKSGLIGEMPNGIPNNLLPYVSQVAIGKLETLSVFGHDYPTADGTAIRDYIHVMDLANGHVKALEKSKQASGFHTYNLGTGNGYSVLDIVREFEKASKRNVSYVLSDRREGDIAVCYADPSKALRELNWKATRDISEMCTDSWNWIQNSEKS